MTIDLFEHRNNWYSQNGEDGILDVLLTHLGLKGGYFVEFGAWDGKHWSNTYHCYKRGWAGCFIEGDDLRFKTLMKNIPDEHILKIHGHVEPSGSNSLDNILLANGIETVDLLSIDVDSDDLSIWEGLRNYKPAVVIIEYNSTIPFDTRYINPKGKSYGNSALSITESAIRRGYRLVEGTDTNLIFVSSNRIGSTDIACKTLQEIRDQTFHLRLFIGHDGTVLHDFSVFNDAGITEIFPVPFAMSFGIQPIPRWLRKVRYRINYAGLIFFISSALFRCPVQLFRLVAVSTRALSNGKGLFGLLKVISNKDQIMEVFKTKNDLDA